LLSARVMRVVAISNTDGIWMPSVCQMDEE
jgi:hypothetical protein